MTTDCGFSLDRILPPAIDRVLAASVLDGQSADAWLHDPSVAPVRKACLLNILAVLRVTPDEHTPLLVYVDRVFEVKADRIYVTVLTNVLHRLAGLVTDPHLPVYQDQGQPLPIHRLILASPTAAGLSDARLLSFRAEGAPSLQLVVAETAAPYTVADLDLDEHNPLQDVVGFIGHMGELLKGDRTGALTDHLALRAVLARGPAAPFLGYTLDERA